MAAPDPSRRPVPIEPPTATMAICPALSSRRRRLSGFVIKALLLWNPAAGRNRDCVIALAPARENRVPRAFRWDRGDGTPALIAALFLHCLSSCSSAENERPAPLIRNLPRGTAKIHPLSLLRRGTA